MFVRFSSPLGPRHTRRLDPNCDTWDSKDTSSRFGLDAIPKIYVQLDCNRTQIEANPHKFEKRLKIHVLATLHVKNMKTERNF